MPEKPGRESHGYVETKGVTIDTFHNLVRFGTVAS